MVRSLITLSILLLLAGQVDGQVVTLNRLQRAGGLGYIPYTDGTGKQGYTLLSSLLSDYLTGTGTAGRIAAWGTADTLTSYIWEITNTYIRGSGTGWPQMENGFFTFRGDTDTGMKRISANSVGLFAGSATNYRLRAGSGVVDMDTDANGIPEWDFQTSTFGGSTAGNPRLYLSGTSNPQYTFSGDEDSGLRRSAANVIGLHAGDAANPVINMNATNITFDPDQDGTNDVTISATTISTELVDIGSYGTTATKIAGLNASGVVTELIVGSGLSISGDSLNADAGLSGSGSASAVATWSSASALTFTDWLILSNVLQGPTLGDPAMSITDDAYSFTGDSNTGLKWSAADIAGLHAGDATNPMIKWDGTVDAITFDPDDDGVAEVTISATTLSTELLDIGTFGTTATKIAGVNASGVITQLTPGLRLSISGDSLIADAGVTGSGSASAVATWSSASALTFTDWLILSNVLQGPTLGDPAMSITDDAYSFTGDSNTGLKWSAADIVGIYAGDATNPLIKADGPGVAVTFDPDDDGVAEVTINATTMTTELLDIGTYGTTATKIAGLNASGVVTELVAGDGLSISGDSLITGRGFGQLAYNGEFEITNTSSDTLDPGFSWAEIEVGLISTDDATHSITTNYAGYAEFMFSTVLFNESGGTFAGAVNFELYKNGSYLAPFFGYTERLENNESKIVTVTGMLSVASGDDFHIRAYLSSAGTIDISRPVFNMKKI